MANHLIRIEQIVIVWQEVMGQMYLLINHRLMEKACHLITVGYLKIQIIRALQETPNNSK